MRPDNLAFPNVLGYDPKMDFLEGKARIVADAALNEEESKRAHVVIALSGAHAYGFPSPDSDLDLKAVHIAPTESFLGLDSTETVSDRLEVIEGVEIDYTSNEIGSVLRGILAGNGNYIERILGALIARSSELHRSLVPLVQASLSRRVHRHYRGFASSQRKAFEAAEKPTAKKLLYVLRTALTGVHLLASGELRVDLNTTAGEYGFADASELIAAKQAGEQTVLSEPLRDQWVKQLDGLFELLDAKLASSVLPESPPNRDEFNQWLIEARCTQLTSV